MLILDEESPQIILDTCEDWNMQTMVQDSQDVPRET